MSIEATCWAIAQRDVPLDHRMVLVLLADCHCPDNGCEADLVRLARNHQIDPDEPEMIMQSLEDADRVARVPGTDQIHLFIDLPPAGQGARVRK